MKKIDFNFIVKVVLNLLVFGLLINWTNGLFLPMYMGGFILYFVKPMVDLETYYKIMIFIMCMCFAVTMIYWLFVPVEFVFFPEIKCSRPEPSYSLNSVYYAIKSIIYIK